MNTKQCFDRCVCVCVCSVSWGSLSNHCSGHKCKMNRMRLQGLREVWLLITLCQTENMYRYSMKMWILFMSVCWRIHQHVASRWTDRSIGQKRKSKLCQTLNVNIEKYLSDKVICSLSYDWTQVIRIFHGLISPSNLSSSRRHFGPNRQFPDKMTRLMR